MRTRRNNILFKKKVGLLLAAMLLMGMTATAKGYKTLGEIQIRDPFIYADKAAGLYYLYASSDTVIDGVSRGGVVVWQSRDLKRWTGTRRVFTVPADNYLTGRVWAPEMHEYQGRFYLFLTLNSDIEWKRAEPRWPKFRHRVVQVMRADSPLGPFLPMSELPTTPIDQMALDGTPYIEDGVPYMVYSREWVEIEDGTYRLSQLTPDLSRTVDDGHDLFHVSVAPWAKTLYRKDRERGYVSDGSFIWKTKKKLLMIFSSHDSIGYTMGVAESTTGRITGPWRVHPETLIDAEGGVGHGMIFRDFEGRLWLVAHSPDVPSGSERARLMRLEETPEGDIRIVDKQDVRR